MKVRVKFSKHGILRFIGHLDVMRYFQKAFRRTDINVKYSTGFSPHMIMSFAHPLGVGLESDGEYFDVELEDDVDFDSIKNKLNATMAEGIEVLKVTRLSDNSMNAMASVAAAEYEISFVNKNPITGVIIDDFNRAKEIIVTKKTKTGSREFNIKDFIFDLKLTDSKISCVIDASSSGNLKPAFLIETIFKYGNIDPEEYKFHVLRKDIFRFKNGTLVPLSKEYE